MRRLIYMLLLAALLFIPLQRVNIADLLPIETLAVYMEESQKPFVIFLDTYEELVNELLPGNPLQNDLWLRDIKTGIIPRVPYVLWVIAGREKLKWESFFAGLMMNAESFCINSVLIWANLFI